MHHISLIVAMAERSRVIGRNNDLPWSKRLRPDMKRFVELTSGHPVIMGSATYISIPENKRPLDKGRSTIVLSRTLEDAISGVIVARSFQEGLARAKVCPGSDEIFIAGGQGVYELALPFADRIYRTLVNEDPEGDRFFPEHPEIARIVASEISPDFEPQLRFQIIDR